MDLAWAGYSLYIESEGLPESWVLWLQEELINPLLFCLVYILGREALLTLLASSFILSVSEYLLALALSAEKLPSFYGSKP